MVVLGYVIAVASDGEYKGVFCKIVVDLLDPGYWRSILHLVLLARILENRVLFQQPL
jgi:hypothetical protein